MERIWTLPEANVAGWPISPVGCVNLARVPWRWRWPLAMSIGLSPGDTHVIRSRRALRYLGESTASYGFRAGLTVGISRTLSEDHLWDESAHDEPLFDDNSEQALDPSNEQLLNELGAVVLSAQELEHALGESSRNGDPEPVRELALVNLEHGERATAMARLIGTVGWPDLGPRRVSSGELIKSLHKWIRKRLRAGRER
jgi:hypothetical protein